MLNCPHIKLFMHGGLLLLVAIPGMAHTQFQQRRTKK